MDEPRSLKFYFDFLSPYSYLAFQATVQLCERMGYWFQPVAVDLSNLKLSAGNTGPSTRQIPAKAKYARIDLARWAKHYKIPLVPPEINDSARVNLGFYYAKETEKINYMQSVWALSWGKGENASTNEFLSKVAHEMNWPEENFILAINTEAIAEKYKAATSTAVASGIFGVPTFVVGEEMWWGNDRLSFVETHLASL